MHKEEEKNAELGKSFDLGKKGNAARAPAV